MRKEAGGMGDSVIQGFYDQLADYYHLIFEDWDRSIERQATALNRLLADRISSGPLKILDCACGIGTQTLGFARAGHHMVASDLSPAAVNRARREAEMRGLNIEFHISDMTNLSAISDSGFDVVAALDNAIPHLSTHGVQEALHAMASKLRPGGLFLASTRDYDELILQRPSVQGPVFYGGEGNRRIVLQVWDWIDQARYSLHQYISVEDESGWKTHHFVSEYRCLLHAEFTKMLETAGFDKVERLLPRESGFFQPIVLAKKA
jgi:glycine/sarcosine N-methyltransferase